MELSRKIVISTYLAVVLIACSTYLALILIGSLQGQDMSSSVLDTEHTETKQVQDKKTTTSDNLETSSNQQNDKSKSSYINAYQTQQENLKSKNTEKKNTDSQYQTY